MSNETKQIIDITLILIGFILGNIGYKLIKKIGKKQ